VHRGKYGAAPIVAFNEVRETDINTPAWLESDVKLIGRLLGVGLFYYGPRLWMLGQVEPLEALQKEKARSAVVNRIVTEYPSATLGTSETFYRLRKDLTNPNELSQYDSPPIALAGTGRLDSNCFPVMYASKDLQICVHECRVTAEDNLFVATLRPKHSLKLLDLDYLLDDDKTEFESLDIAVHMLFLAGKHAYPITRAIALAAHKAGFDGLAYPSYFSLLRTGRMPFQTVLGISQRKIPELAEYERRKTIRNLALFGRPIERGVVSVECVNRIVIRQVDYGLQFGPVGVEVRNDEGDGSSSRS
jgi:hypothetical protein